MKRSSALLALAALSALALVAQPLPGGMHGGKPAHFKLLGAYGKAEAEALREEFAGALVGELRVEELAAWADRLSVAEAKDAWVARSAKASFMLPGAGQFMNGKGAEGGLFAAAHVATVVGTWVAWYYLLPAELRFEQLDYYRDDWSTIKARWEGQSLADYLPAMGAMAGGMALDLVWRAWSAHGALFEARAAIDGGRKGFEPSYGPGSLGFVFRY